eukprot:m.96363 g.96363  ORF g.96363 m.96363 type:complete len:352 (-) comp21981_c0_seq2:18-1073(-)
MAQVCVETSVRKLLKDAGVDAEDELDDVFFNYIQSLFDSEVDLDDLVDGVHPILCEVHPDVTEAEVRTLCKEWLGNPSTPLEPPDEGLCKILEQPVCMNKNDVTAVSQKNPFLDKGPAPVQWNIIPADPQLEGCPILCDRDDVRYHNALKWLSAVPISSWRRPDNCSDAEDDEEVLSKLVIDPRHNKKKKVIIPVEEEEEEDDNDMEDVSSSKFDGSYAKVDSDLLAIFARVGASVEDKRTGVFMFYADDDENQDRFHLHLITSRRTGCIKKILLVFAHGAGRQLEKLHLQVSVDKQYNIFIRSVDQFSLTVERLVDLWDQKESRVTQLPPLLCSLADYIAMKRKQLADEH